MENLASHFKKCSIMIMIESKLLESISKVFFYEVLSVCYCFRTAGGINAEENTRGGRCAEGNGG